MNSANRADEPWTNITRQASRTGAQSDRDTATCRLLLIDELLTIAFGIGLAGLGLVRRMRGGRSSLGATVQRIGTDASTGVATATEHAAKQAGSLAGNAVSITGSVVVGGASLMADGIATLASVATGMPLRGISTPARTTPARSDARPAKAATKATTKATGAGRSDGARSKPTPASTSRKAPATSNSGRARKSR